MPFLEIPEIANTQHEWNNELLCKRRPPILAVGFLPLTFMDKDTTQSASSSWTRSELQSGLHLLTDLEPTVKVRTPSVPSDEIQYYPRLTGSNWTCYITGDSAVLGRSTEQSTRQRRPDVDFGPSKLISRKHAEIRFSRSRKRWELVIHGANGVTVNSTLRKPPVKAIPLTTGSLLEINGTRFIFILPAEAQNRRPDSTKSSNANATASEASTPQQCVDEDSSTYESMIAEILESAADGVNTKDIAEAMARRGPQEFTGGNLAPVLQILATSSKFELAENSLDIPADQADSIVWRLKHASPSSTQQSTSKTESIAATPKSVATDPLTDTASMDDSIKPSSSHVTSSFEPTSPKADSPASYSDNVPETESVDEPLSSEPTPTLSTPSPTLRKRKGLTVEETYMVWLQLQERLGPSIKRTKTTQHQDPVTPTMPLNSECSLNNKMTRNEMGPPIDLGLVT
ncbi:uncharacterized protein BYT42DRAFT_186061 [Radiomyces spectabilis]|uniref:uncharacterized protein n=1 Tax=Radiomyces spectabilis TaxID=64574 RepID=UPI00221FAB48|nr:uncharacterized protein BYT42DRAFT_186061 [Radiomyces spectabilis]KAI8391217.1 hypothetical protein BYT42DRAFT_186061 [Radiomyces spectabilis]